MIQIVDVGWKYKKENNRYEQRIKFYDEEDNELKKVNLKDFSFNFKLSGERYCPGYYEEGIYHPCPQKNTLYKKSYEQCFYCEKKTGFKSAFLFGQEPNESMKQYLSLDHYIYLTYFEPGKIKVGTASGKRMNERLIEQDGLIFVFIAKSDGFNIQRLERQISKSFINITETVNSSFKIKHIHEKPDFDKSRKMILSSYDQVLHKFKDDEDFKTWFLDKIEVVDLTNLKEIFYPEYKPKIIKDDLNIFGEFKGLRGRYILIENFENIVAFDIKDIIGRKIDSYISDYRYPVNYEGESEKIGFQF